MSGRDIVNYDEKWARDAERYAKQHEVKGGAFLSTRGGILSFGDEVLPGNQAPVIILDSVAENTYYQGKFDPDNVAAPVCYAFGRDGEDMAPHPSMQQSPEYFVPQATECAVCPWNEYGSADKGKGKACQNRYRLTMIPAGFYQPKRGSRDFDLDVFTDPKHYQTADIAFLKLPVLSGRNFDKYVSQLNATIHRPPHGVITRIFVEPDPKAQYKVHFELIEEVSTELADIIFARHDEAMKIAIQGYAPPEAKPQVERGSLRGLRR